MLQFSIAFDTMERTITTLEYKTMKTPEENEDSN